MNKAFYKQLDRDTCAWDLTASCRQYVFNNKSRRQLRKRLRRKSRKLINKVMFARELTSC